jgi:D-arabinose 1-dehydrogenase-like Zn-dependent alcohol dehydrogenase
MHKSWQRRGPARTNRITVHCETLQDEEVPALQLLLKSQQVKGWYSGTSIDSQETLAFSVLSGVRSMNESYPLEQVNEAYERMVQGKARFRVVLTMEK